MERDSILSHGCSEFLQNSGMDRSDKFTVNINNINGLIANNVHEDRIVSVNMPYTMKLLLQELQSMSIAPRLITG